MTICSSTDITILGASQPTISQCMKDSLSGAAIQWPTGPAVRSCMSSAGVSTDCSSCWGHFYTEIKICLIDICGETPTRELPSANNPQSSQQCIACMQNLPGNVLMLTNEPVTICGIDQVTLSDINWYSLTVTKKASVKSITTSAILLALLMI
jgi:hypothetical protein